MKRKANDTNIIPIYPIVDDKVFKSARSKLLEIQQSADDLVNTYLRLYQDLNDLYDQHPKLYQKIQQVVTLPTNEDALNISEFNKTLKQQLSYFKDDDYLKSILSDNVFEMQ